MAEVKKGDREKSGFPDNSFPVSTAAQIRSAIKLRHNSKKHSAASVLAHCAAAISRLRSKGIITESTAKGLRAAIERARQADKGSK